MPRSPHRTRVLAVRLTRGELATLRARAYVAGLPASTYVRERALAPRRRVRAGRLRPADIERLVPLGTDLNGFARAANTARRIVGARELVELLNRIASAVRALAAEPGA